MAQIPRDSAPDSTLALLTDGYDFISKRAQRYGTDVFATRLFLRDAYCVTGPEAAEVFYTPDRFTRNGALPQTTLRLLQDKGSVAVLDDGAHRLRKQMFMSMMTPERVTDLVDLAVDEWQVRMPLWQRMERVVLLDAVREILTRAASRWSGIPPLSARDGAERTRELAAMIEGAGSIGPRNWRGQLLRERTERWCREIIHQVRNGDLKAPEESAAHVIAWHRDEQDRLLDPKIASVELLNIIRPTVAVSRFVVFSALALHEHPEIRTALTSGDDGAYERFVQEVRRFYPFFPFVGGRALEEFTWRDNQFEEGTWFLLDLYGTNHDPAVWDKPNTFDPEHFRHWDGSPYNFIPQGGGDFVMGHRCAGEWITIQVLKALARQLVTAMEYDVPPQDLQVRLSSMPAIPKSGFVMTNIRPAA
ncbi:MAG: cytochrome P450 [Thermomicrobiales bacterium]